MQQSLLRQKTKQTCRPCELMNEPLKLPGRDNRKSTSLLLHITMR
jgi:hypothetical protein